MYVCMYCLFTIFGFGSLVLRMLQTFIVLKTGCRATPILELRLSNRLLVFSVVFWSTKGRENMILGRLSLLFSIVSLCTLSATRLVINLLIVAPINLEG